MSDHFLFKRFGRAIAKPGVLTIWTDQPLGAPETAPRVAEEGPAPQRGHFPKKVMATSDTKLLNMEHEGGHSILFARDQGKSSRN